MQTALHIPEGRRHPAPSIIPRSTRALQRQCTCGSSATGPTGECGECRRKRLLHSNLRVTSPGDMYEQQADRIADHVMRHASAQRIEAAPSGPATAPAIVDDVLTSPGHPLDATTRSFMEPRFGHDFSHVRVHTDRRAAASAAAVHAAAYTVGAHIVFGTGQHAPGTAMGRRLIAHELAHTLQQTGANGPVARTWLARQYAEDLEGGSGAQTGEPAFDMEGDSLDRKEKCRVACKALASQRRAADGVCDLTGEEDARCKEARKKVRKNEERVRAAGCKCVTKKKPLPIS